MNLKDFVQSLSGEPSPFIDVNKDHWAYNHILAVVKKGLFKGYEKNNFIPSKPITRAEMATVITNYLNISGSSNKKNNLSLFYPDTQNHWGAFNIKELLRMKIISGYHDGTFRPDKPILRSEVAALINNLLIRGPINANQGKWRDLNPQKWSFGSIQAATLSSEYIFDENGNEILQRLVENKIW
jgi:hypothetical protein